MGRIIGGIIAGIVAAFATIWCIDLIGQVIHPIPAAADISSRQAIGAYIAGMPASAKAIVVAAWFFGAADGGIVAALISRRHWALWLIAGLVALVAILNVVMIPHPGWMQIAAVAAPLLGGLLASLVVQRIGPSQSLADDTL